MTHQEKYLVTESELPEGFSYPTGFVRVVQQGLVNLTPWRIMEAEHVRKELRRLAERYPSRRLIPFAYRRDNDDLACWELAQGDKVFIVHNFAAEGFEREGEFPGFWDWFRSAVEETIEWD